MRRTVVIAVMSAAIGALVAAPISVYAAHRFNDVSSSNTFHDDIAWLAEAGITKGCNPPANTEFCPDEEVTREQMAAFIHRLADAGVVDAGSIGGFDSGDVLIQREAGHRLITTGLPSTRWIPLSGDEPTDFASLQRQLEVSADGKIIGALDLPSPISTTDFNLTRLTFCVDGLTPGVAYMSAVEVWGALATPLFRDTTIVDSVDEFDECHDYDMDIDPRSHFPQVVVRLQGGGDLVFHSVIATWSPA